MSAPLDIVRRMYTAFGAADEEALRRLIDPDVQWDQCEGFPGGSNRRGVEDVISGVLHGNRDTWIDFSAPIEELLDMGEHVVALGRYEGTHSGTGQAMRAAFAHVYRVEGGRIVHFRQYADTWPMVRAMGGSVSS